jgi:hypothetical protein
MDEERFRRRGTPTGTIGYLKGSGAASEPVQEQVPNGALAARV